jgi:hypothetical protein
MSANNCNGNCNQGRNCNCIYKGEQEMRRSKTDMSKLELIILRHKLIQDKNYKRKPCLLQSLWQSDFRPQETLTDSGDCNGNRTTGG